MPHLLQAGPNWNCEGQILSAAAGHSDHVADVAALSEWLIGWFLGIDGIACVAVPDTLTAFCGSAFIIADANSLIAVIGRII